ncbi:MAG: sigma-70 family RNA polymerase sigma factor [Verrucomicrobiales bacterium]|nr:sigma-70 family RNA polymerase sigma factor [Verrucomicrobiales bacterium]MCP5526353.1 sigma-70 family RNA polymerase sigma factor [Verrucomicrobiales bacterium]
MLKLCSDQELLTRYSRERSEAAFAELVRRHAGRVYAAAVRLVVDAHLAEDVVQQAFVALSRNARPLAHRPVLSAWLQRTTRNLAVMTIRREERRRAREQKAELPADSQPPGVPGYESAWNEVRPYLDHALARLSATDRNSIALRYFDRKTAAEIGQALGISAEAAQKRVHRALERLRRGLAKSGVALPVSTLGAALDAHLSEAAPASVVEPLSRAVLARLAGANSVGVWSGSVQGILVQPVAATMVGLLLVSLGVGGYLTGRAAAREHWQAVHWHNALSTNPPLERMVPEHVPAPVRFDRAGFPSLAAPDDRGSVDGLLAAAAEHFRRRDEDPDAYAKGFVLLDQLQPDDVAEALRALEAYRYEPEVFAMMAPLVVKVWARTDPKAALDYTLTRLDETSRGLAVQILAGSWAQQDPQAAWDWYRETSASSDRPMPDGSWMWVPKFIFGEWAVGDAAGAVGFLDHIPYGDRDQAVFGIADAARDPAARPGILAAIEAVNEEGQKRELARRVAARWAETEPAAAADWAASLHFDNPAAMLAVMGEVAEEWWPIDHHATARWLLANAPQEVLGQVWAGLARMTHREPQP